MREAIIKTVLEKKLIAIVRGVEGKYATGLADALFEGGIELMELTFNQSRPETHADTASAIKALREHCNGRMIIGAGTVTSVEQARIASDAGAQFIVSPNTNTLVIEKTRALNMVSMPGALTPTEIAMAHDAGADFVKIFPAANLGAEYIKAIRGPLSHVRLIAVGGIDSHNLSAFIKAGCVGAGVGGNLVNKEWIRGGEFEKITQLAKEYRENLN